MAVGTRHLSRWDKLALSKKSRIQDPELANGQMSEQEPPTIRLSRSKVVLLRIAERDSYTRHLYKSPSSRSTISTCYKQTVTRIRASSTDCIFKCSDDFDVPARHQSTGWLSTVAAWKWLAALPKIPTIHAATSPHSRMLPPIESMTKTSDQSMSLIEALGSTYPGAPFPAFVHTRSPSEPAVVVEDQNRIRLHGYGSENVHSLPSISGEGDAKIEDAHIVQQLRAQPKEVNVEFRSVVY